MTRVALAQRVLFLKFTNSYFGQGFRDFYGKTPGSRLGKFGILLLFVALQALQLTFPSNKVIEAAPDDDKRYGQEVCHVVCTFPGPSQSGLGARF